MEAAEQGEGGDLTMLDRLVEKAREEKVFSHEDTPLGQRVLAAFLYHAKLSYRKIESFVERSYEAVREWFHRLKHLSSPTVNSARW